jgi:hypothetical protein
MLQTFERYILPLSSGSTLKMEASCTSETQATSLTTTQCNNPIKTELSHSVPQGIYSDSSPTAELLPLSAMIKRV